MSRANAAVACAALAALALAACRAPEERAAEHAPPQELRILTWNLHHGEGTDGKLDLERIAAVIRSVDPDWVALQEIDRGVLRTRGADMPAELARLTGLHPVFGDNIDYQGGRYGNLALVRLPPQRTQNHALRSHYAGEQRGLLELAWDGPQGPLRLLATHWDYRGDYEAERLESAEHAVRLASEERAALVVLAGDLNALPDSKTIAALQGNLVPAHGATPRPTYPAGNPTRQIDYVWFAPAERWEVRECRVLDEAVASDHRALLVVLRSIAQSR